ncbi:hypothetical protein PsorP6_016634 [Peronosclerospora sorghi]|uniref:Uncharacterized protein n=1 Tax=Peronosclerospora sorghi TaxID=230839 RepID=A0ACC0VNM1_9STRA|nr:hypothetical protein PsorP6_016634 [Peronosclerospora sorghi]
MELTRMEVMEADIKKGYSTWEEKGKGMYPDLRNWVASWGASSCNPPLNATADALASILVFGSAPRTGVEKISSRRFLSVNATTSSTPDDSQHLAQPVPHTPHKRRLSASISDSVTLTTSKRNSWFKLSDEREKRKLAELAAQQEKVQVEWKKPEW